MHFHLPKPLHGWRAFAGEVGIIVVGVLIALGAEQLVEIWTWHQKVAAAERSLGFEINVQLDSAEEAVALHKCAATYFDALESAIGRHDSPAIQKLYSAEPPFEAREWRSTAWQSVMSTQVADHMDAVAMAQYGFIYSGSEEIRDLQESIVADLGQATMGRLAGAADPASAPLELAATERLRGELREVASISAGMLLVARGEIHAGWKPIHRVRSPRLDNEIRSELQSCEAASSAARDGES